MLFKSCVIQNDVVESTATIAVSDFEDFFEIGEVVFATCHPGTFFGTTCLRFHVWSVESMTVTATKWEIDI